MNMNGERIIISKQNILSGYQKIDYAFYSEIDYCFEEKGFPLFVQSEYYFNNNEFIKNDNEYIFKIHKDRIYLKYRNKSSL